MKLRWQAKAKSTEDIVDKTAELEREYVPDNVELTEVSVQEQMPTEVVLDSQSIDGSSSHNAAPQPIAAEKRRLIVSLLTFSEFERCQVLLSKICPWLAEKAEALNFEIAVIVRNNNPQLDSTKFDQIWQQLYDEHQSLQFMLFNDGYNVGFGRGHNLNFLATKSDIFLIMNDDIALPGMDWLDRVVTIFDSSPKVGAIGASQNPTSITPFFGNGVHEKRDATWALRYAEASILAIRSTVFAEVGQFDDDYPWAMFEDADLSFRLQAHGHDLAWIDIPHQHWRSSSVNILPSQAKYSILEHNRSVLFSKWNIALRENHIGRLEIYDVWSDGIGDVFCGLLHLSVYLNGLTLQRQGRVVVNTSAPDLARMLLGTHVEIQSHQDEQSLRTLYATQGIRALKTIRGINYGLPFNIHALVCGALGIPVASHEELASALHNIDRVGPTIKDRFGIEGSYCVLHMESDRQKHDGRVPSPLTIKAIASLAATHFDQIVVVGTRQFLPPNVFEDCPAKIHDLQDQLSRQTLIRLIADSAWFVGIDSFPAHVAQVAGIKSAIFYGSIHPTFRVLQEARTWPIVKPMDCVGCYHTSLEPSIPFCMRRDVACTKDFDDKVIQSSMIGCASGEPYDWRRLTGAALEFQRMFFLKMYNHPAPEQRFFDFKRISNETASTLIYRIIDQVHDAIARDSEHSPHNSISRELGELRAELFQKDVRIESMIKLVADLRAGRDTENPA